MFRGFEYQTVHFANISDQQQDWFIVFPALQSSYALDPSRVERIGAEPVERVGAKRDHPALFDY
jgi:hypothetical protein